MVWWPRDIWFKQWLSESMNLHESCLWQHIQGAHLKWYEKDADVWVSCARIMSTWSFLSEACAICSVHCNSAFHTTFVQRLPLRTWIFARHFVKESCFEPDATVTSKGCDAAVPSLERHAAVQLDTPGGAQRTQKNRINPYAHPHLNTLRSCHSPTFLVLSRGRRTSRRRGEGGGQRDPA